MIENREKLKKIIKEKFAVDDFNLVNKYIDNPPMGKKLKKIFEESEDLRLSFKIEKNGEDSVEFDLFLRLLQILENQFDLSLISKEFSHIYKTISYKDFEKNKILFLKNEIKIFKTIINVAKKNISKILKVDSFLLNFYRNNFFELEDYEFKDNINLVEKILEAINTRKSSSKSKYLVISKNPVDFLLCATGENWSSCLNLNSSYSGITWAHLPGWFGDKSRVIVYITDNETKEYKGIETKKFIARSWAIYDGDAFHIIRWFPQSLLSVKELNKTTKGSPLIKFLNKKMFISEYEIEPITYHNLILSPYLDFSRKIIVCNKMFYSSSTDSRSEGIKIFKNDLTCYTNYNIWHSEEVEDIDNVKEAFVNISEVLFKSIDCESKSIGFCQNINEDYVIFSDVNEKEKYNKHLILDDNKIIQGVLVREDFNVKESSLYNQFIIKKG